MLAVNKADEPVVVKEEINDKCEKVTPAAASPVINNHNAVDNIEATFSDDETEPAKPIKIEEEDEDVPLGRISVSSVWGFFFF